MPHDRGLQGHSDADVGLHTITDAIYGALAEAMNHWEASRVGAVLALVPVGAVGATTLAAGVWPHWIEPERIGMMGWLGGLVVMAASMTISVAPSGCRWAVTGSGVL